ncbi:MAG: SHOCT domain-containing protein [Thermoleophilia bacterium]
MKAIDAGYLGGHPGFRDEIEDGWLELGEEGEVTYAAVRRVNMMERRVVEFALRAQDVLSIEVHADAKINRGGTLREYALGGVIGAAHHHKRVGSKNRPIEVLALIDGVQRVLHFASEGGAAVQWLSEVSAVRARVGLPPLASESHSTEEQPQPSQDGSVADEIRKFGDLLKDGLLTQEEFDSQKQRLLGLK